jgi:hypothetical protein
VPAAHALVSQPLQLSALVPANARAQQQDTRSTERKRPNQCRQKPQVAHEPHWLDARRLGLPVFRLAWRVQRVEALEVISREARLWSVRGYGGHKSFVQPRHGPGNRAQKRLCDCATALSAAKQT